MRDHQHETILHSVRHTWIAQATTDITNAALL